MAVWGVFVLFCLVLLILPLVSTGMAFAAKTLTQRAADSSALAGASQALFSQQRDGRGQIYCDSVAVDPVNGPVAAGQYWADNTSGMTTLQTTTFAAIPNGATMTVTVTVALPPGGFALFGFSKLTWTVTAQAKVLLPAGDPAC